MLYNPAHNYSKQISSSVPDIFSQESQKRHWLLFKLLSFIFSWSALSLVIHFRWKCCGGLSFQKPAVTQRLFLETCSHAQIHARTAGPQLERCSPEGSPLHGPTAAESSPLRFNMRFTDNRSGLPIMSTHYWSLAMPCSTKLLGEKSTGMQSNWYSFISMITAKKQAVLPQNTARFYV